MKEKKFTDKEIIKAYEHCYVNDGTCKSCCLSDEDKPCVSHEDVLDLINRQKAEIERLTEENGYIKAHADQFLADYQKAQKQMDELKEERENMQAVIFALEAEKRQAVKDTAKEIIKWIKLNGLLAYGGYVIHDSTIEQMCKKYGVEVE